MRRRLVLLGALGVVILGIGVAVASTGGDEPAEQIASGPTGATGLTGATGATGATGQLDKGEYVAQADAICSEAALAAGQLESGFESEEPSAEDVTEEADILNTQLRQLGDLNPPDDDRETLSDYLSALKQQQRSLADMAMALNDGDDDAAGGLQDEAATAKAQALAAAQDYGLQACAGAEEAIAESPVVPAEPTDVGEAIEEAAEPTTTVPTEVPEVPTEVPTTTPTTPTEVPPADDGSGGAGTGGGVGTESDGGGGGSSGGVTP